MEELLVLVRGPYAVHQTRLFTRSITDPELWARMVSACAGGVHWLTEPPTSVPALWPQSSFVTAGLKMQLLEDRLAQALLARDGAPESEQTRLDIANRIRALLRGGESPSTPIGPAQLTMYDQYLTDTLEGTALLSHARQWMGDVRTARDFRGMLHMLLTTLNLG